MPFLLAPNPIIWPFLITFVFLIPHSCSAMLAWCCRKAYSPCTGKKLSGFTIFRISFCSSWYACPEVCRFSPLPIAISHPYPARLFIIFITLDSFPGMTLAEYRMRSSG